MKEYPHIDSVYKRDPQGKFMMGEYSTPEFKYLEDKPWTWTEKIDGTNIRVMLKPDVNGGPLWVEFGGKTDNAQIPSKLLIYLANTFSLPKMLDIFGDTEVCLYGEGYGAGIQKGGGLYSAEQKFILFDVKIGDWWLLRKDVEDIAAKLGIDVVKIYTPTSLSEMIAYVQYGHLPNFYSNFDLPDKRPEGYVGQPSVPLFNRKGQRVITKVKYKDFK